MNDSDTDSDNPYVIPALERGVRILMLFDRQRPEISAPDIARELAIPRTTVFRLLQTLEHVGLVARTESGRYRAGPAVLRLGFEYLASLDVVEIGRPVVEQLRDATDLPAQLVIRDGREVVVVVRAASASAFESAVRVGTRMPAHATILGRVLLGALTDAELRKLYPERELAQVSPKTPRTPADLARLVAEDRARGYAISDSFFESNVSAVAAPVRDAAGAIVAAISVTAQRAAIAAADRVRLAEHVQLAAREFSQRLGYSVNLAAA
jgi:DNA-binding IclR family transcriptional regulator